MQHHYDLNRLATFIVTQVLYAVPRSKTGAISHRADEASYW
jgi:hypothetical protein